MEKEKEMGKGVKLKVEEEVEEVEEVEEEEVGKVRGGGGEGVLQ